MAHALESTQVTRKGFGIGACLSAIARVVAAEQTLALRAADAAAMPRRKLAELRAMYVRPLER